MLKRISNSGYERNTAGRSVGPHLSPVIYAVAVGAKLGLRQCLFFYFKYGPCRARPPDGEANSDNASLKIMDVKWWLMKTQPARAPASPPMCAQRYTRAVKG